MDSVSAMLFHYVVFNIIVMSLKSLLNCQIEGSAMSLC